MKTWSRRLLTVSACAQILGDGQIQQSLDTAQAIANLLRIAGAGPQEAAGGEIWMDDVTGDGLGDLIIGRPNYRASSPDRIGAGALTIVVGRHGRRRQNRSDRERDARQWRLPGRVGRGQSADH